MGGFRKEKSGVPSPFLPFALSVVLLATFFRWSQCSKLKTDNAMVNINLKLAFRKKYRKFGAKRE